MLDRALTGKLASLLPAEKRRALGRYARKSWSVSWPMILIMLFDFTINLTDVYIAGTLGKEVQASVGFVSQVYFLFIVIANALTVGTVATVSRLYGSGQKDELDRTVATVVQSSAGAGLFLGITGFLIAPVVIAVLRVPAAVKQYGIPLIQFYTIGLAFHYFLINTNGILRSTGRVRRSLLTMACVCVLNVGLNVLLVFYTPLGFRGIALSTALSLFAGAALNFTRIGKFALAGGKFSLEILKRVFDIGWPAGFLGIAWQLGSTMLFLILGAIPGDTVAILAAFTNGLRIESAIFLPAFALNMANAVIVGNLMGEKKLREAFRAGLVTGLLGVTVISAMTLAVVLNAGRLSALLSDNGTVVSASVRYLYICMISEPFMAWAVILGGALNGAGDTRGVMRIVIFSQWAVRLPLAYLIGVRMGAGPAAVWWCMNASILVHAVLVSIRYNRSRWLHNA